MARKPKTTTKVRTAKPVRIRPRRPPVRECSTHRYFGEGPPRHDWCKTCEGIYQRTNNFALKHAREPTT